jgi:threonine dehydrogenase-like Zn-dependent dehydrogenase
MGDTCIALPIGNDRHLIQTPPPSQCMDGDHRDHSTPRTDDRRTGGGIVKAVVLTPERKLELEDRPVREPGPREVLIASEYCGICGTDLHAADLDIFAPPVTIGHEFSGVIAALGPGVTGWHVGDRVAVNPNGNTCNVCEACRASRPNLCTTAVFDNGLGVRRDGGMAEFATIPAVHLHQLPDSVDSKRGAWTEPLAVAIRTRIRHPAR